MTNIMTNGVTNGEGFLITSDMLQPIVDSVTSNLNAILPVGIGIMALMIGVRLIRKVIYRFI